MLQSGSAEAKAARGQGTLGFRLEPPVQGAFEASIRARGAGGVGLRVCGAGAGGRKVLWHNMREEPVLYINGRPYVVREADKPFQNLEYTGIDRSRVEDMEKRLKDDVLQEVRPPQHTHYWKYFI